MSFLSYTLRKILSDRAFYCCLCYKSIGEMDTSFSIEDEVTISIDNERTEIMFKILSTVLGDQVLDSISTQIMCQKCTETAINSYKFIQQCRNYNQQLQRTIECLQNHNKDISEETYDYKSLFLVLNTNNFNVDSYYDKNRNICSPTSLYKRFQIIQEESQQLFIEIELESASVSSNNKKYGVKRKKHTKVTPSLQLADIVHNKDDLNILKCKMCLKLYSTAMKLKEHYIRVHGPKDFKCSECPRSFGTWLLLKRHKQYCHCTVICSQCGKTYTNIYSLRHHEKSHKSRLICQTCGKIYKGTQALKNHIEMRLCEKMRKSNAESKFICNYCGKKYSQKTALSVHIRIEHENGKSVKCDWCSKKFSSISRLRDHIVKHTKQKNFECDICGGKFVTQTSLLYHTRMHTGEKPYKCEFCDETFISASRRSEHVKKHHRVIDLECDICQSKFKGNSCLLRHRRKHFDTKSRLYCKPTTLAT